MAKPVKSSVLKKAETKTVESPIKRKIIPGEKRDYLPTETYQEGETVFHPIWDDTGEVLEVGVTDDGIKKMKVQFSKVGLKVLCMGQQTS
ncbi:MAG: hypothetical protein HQM08_15570 [Candidatus Riflebacteria bacterium]|nr:hypothetical protein [Candidatus Riflebacteria bacterium]